MGRRAPALVLGPSRYLGPLGVMRSLSSMDVSVYSLDHQELSIAGVSRFSAGRFNAGLHGNPQGFSEDIIVEQLLAVAGRLGDGAVLIPASDAWARFVAAHGDRLAARFRFPRLSPGFVDRLLVKHELADLAAGSGLQMPRTVRANSIDEALAAAREVGYPVVVKPIGGGPAKVALARDEAQLAASVEMQMSIGGVSVQEYIQEPESVWMFNGYFDQDSLCLAEFTARKKRQAPFELGLCSYGVCERNEELARVAKRFLTAVGYRGPVDMDFVWDRRDTTYKILDVNPRIGGAFRLMVDRNGLDVARAMYLDLTGEQVPEVVPVNGRTWLIESCELLEYGRYRRERGLGLGDWLKTLRDADERALFSLSDPAPFLMAAAIIIRDTVKGRVVRGSSRHGRFTRPKPNAAPPSAGPIPE